MSCLHVKCTLFCQSLIKFQFSRQSFVEFTNIKFDENPSTGSRVFSYRYIHMYIHTYIKTEVHKYIHAYIRICCIHTYIHTYITYIHTYISFHRSTNSLIQQSDIKVVKKKTHDTQIKQMTQYNTNKQMSMVLFAVRFTLTF